MKSTIPGAGLPDGDFENKTSTAPKLELGLGAKLGNKVFGIIQCVIPKSLLFVELEIVPKVYQPLNLFFFSPINEGQVDLFHPAFLCTL